MGSIMVILDGMQDIAYDALGGCTPFEAGMGESIRSFVEQSRTGTLKSTPDSFVPDTMACIVTLLGVPAQYVPRGRSYIEALVQGMDVTDDDIILRCNFVKLDGNGNLEVPCYNAPKELAMAVRAELAAQSGHFITPVGGYKSLQLIKGRAGDLEGLETFAPHQHQGESFEDLLPRGNQLAIELADVSRSMYGKYKPCTVLNWSPAVKAKVPSFASIHGGMKGGMVSKTDAPMGAAIAMEMECPSLPTATGDVDTDLSAKLEATLDLFSRNDFVMLHVGGPDEATHRQNPVEKANFIKRTDAEIFAPLMKRVPEGTRVMLTCDHAALCTTAGHTNEPVDFWIWEKGRILSGDLGLNEGIEAISLLGRDV